MLQRMPAKTDTNISFRVSFEQRAELKRRADAAGKTMTEYVLGSALGTLEVPGTTERLEALELRVKALEAG